MDCINLVATKALVCSTVTAQLIYASVFVYAKSRFSLDAAQFEALLPALTAKTQIA